MKTSENQWPAIDFTYKDVDGLMEPSVYVAAGEIWEWASAFSVSTLRNRDIAYDLLRQAVILVSQEARKSDVKIENLKAYLRQTYKHLVFYELRKENRRANLRDRYVAEHKSEQALASEDLDRKILIEQLYRRMDPWMRQAFDLLVLGYTADRVAEFFGVKPNYFRSLYSKKLAKLKEQIYKDSQKINAINRHSGVE